MRGPVGDLSCTGGPGRPEEVAALFHFLSVGSLPQHRHVHRPRARLEQLD